MLLLGTDGRTTRGKGMVVVAVVKGDMRVHSSPGIQKVQKSKEVRLECHMHTRRGKMSHIGLSVVLLKE